MKVSHEPFSKVKVLAERGDANAQYSLGVCYAKGDGVAKDYVEAVKWCRKAAEQNLALAQFNLGFSYENGDGVAKDWVEAVKWYRKAAEQNLANAQFCLGSCYAYGVGVVKDEIGAVKWYRKAADQNLADAQFILGFCYANGVGVAKDTVEAVKWYRKAAEQNDADAQYSLGVCYAKGEGVARDYEESYKWMLLAAQGQEEAKRDMPIILEARLLSRASEINLNKKDDKPLREFPNDNQLIATRFWNDLFWVSLLNTSISSVIWFYLLRDERITLRLVLVATTFLVTFCILLFYNSFLVMQHLARKRTSGQCYFWNFLAWVAVNFVLLILIVNIFSDRSVPVP